ncbi:hypothetical protein PSTT_02333 [Puccinia striiformis]|uniref:Uncharacterized protein n=1 Tax=Puccinia striiformis TaxID=27350 RepID=A0A2S4W055_9BASI|nr:hypothetical protein PSTT_02333 [Puccinia striiformis]
MSLVKLLTSLLAHPRQTFTAVILSLLVFYFIHILDNIVASVLPFKPFHIVYSYVRISVLVSLNQTENSVLETTDLWQLSNALLFMDVKLSNHTKISSQVRNLANVYSLFTDEIEKLDLAGIHTIELISQEYFKMIYQSKHTETQVINSMLKLSNYEVDNLQANVNRTIKLASHLLAEQDDLDLVPRRNSSLERAQYRRGLWISERAAIKWLKSRKRWHFSFKIKSISSAVGLYVECRRQDCRLGVDICALFRSIPEIEVIQSTTDVGGA